MVNLTDLIITHYGTNQSDQIVDSYEMIKGIIVDFEGQANFNIKLDNTLPLINGDPKQLKILFKNFIRKAIELFNGLIGEINITHIKDSKSWIFACFAISLQNEGAKRYSANLSETVNEFNMAISKKSLSRKADVILSF
ncbi:hypothetical protein [Algoriphagus yeomjeoni]|uniref:Uncharacterized protein n=1 Tax=Algoriphagus yeomjeoni TaxID=291403 RepID=A0A327PQ13_9BACT|nr:hypothetical protein [Algoriphagus yeomjeoni]RAI94149.1 hypothetical protein LV83_01056 [Algoriphagus yeomjeoni]